jgi:hypothetical protein
MALRALHEARKPPWARFGMAAEIVHGAGHVDQVIYDKGANILKSWVDRRRACPPFLEHVLSRLKLGAGPLAGLTVEHLRNHIGDVGGGGASS